MKRFWRLLLFFLSSFLKFLKYLKCVLFPGTFLADDFKILKPNLVPRLFQPFSYVCTHPSHQPPVTGVQSKPFYVCII